MSGIQVMEGPREQGDAPPLIRDRVEHARPGLDDGHIALRFLWPSAKRCPYLLGICQLGRYRASFGPRFGVDSEVMSNEPPLPVSAPQQPSVSLQVEGEPGRRTWAFYERPDNVAADGARDGLSLVEMLDLLRMGRWHMLIGALAVGALGVAYLLLAAPTYSVGAQLIVLRQMVLANQGERPTGTSLFLATQAEIISSSLVIASALEALPETPAESIGEDGGDARDAVEAVASMVSATPVKGTSALALRYIGPSPTEGESILEAVIGSYRDFTRGLDRADHRRDVDVLAAHEAELRQDLEERIAQYSRIHAENAAAGAGPDGESMHKALLERLSRELVLARAQLIKLENEQVALNEHGHLSRERQASPGRQKLVEELWRMQLKVTELRAIQGDQHPVVSGANLEVAALRGELKNLEQWERAALASEVESARSTEARLGAAYGHEVERAQTIEAQYFEQRKLKDEVDRLSESHQAVFASLRREELTQRSLVEGRPRVAIHVIEPPVAPTSPMWPQPLLVMLPCIAIGAFLGLGVAWLKGPLEAADFQWIRGWAPPHDVSAAIKSEVPTGSGPSRAPADRVGPGDAADEAHDVTPSDPAADA